MSDAKDKSTDIKGDREEGFLSRWSRRKLESGEDQAEDPSTSIASSEQQEEGGEDLEPAPVLTDADMPPLEDLGEHSDYSGFLSPGVSENLRQAALRKLFRSAKFNVCDGLDDYAEDYTKFAPLGDVITADMRYHMERALKKLVDDEEAGGAGPAATLTREPSTAAETEGTRSGAGETAADGGDLEGDDDSERA